MGTDINFDKLIVIAPNFKRRLSGVTSTIIQLVPRQQSAGLGIAVTGAGLPESFPWISPASYWRLWKRPTDGKPRVWHARRNIEMLPGLIMKALLRMPLKLVFTSASQRHHTDYSRWLIRRMDAVIATSEKTSSYLNVPNTVIMHGIDTDRFCPPAHKEAAKRAVRLPHEKKIVGCFGRIRAQKGTDLFVDAMIKALGERPNWIAIVAGRATQEHVSFQRGLESRIAAAGMEERIRFVGEHTDIERWYQALDLFIAPQAVSGQILPSVEVQ